MDHCFSYQSNNETFYQKLGKQWIGNKKQGGLSQALAVAYRQGISKPNFLQSKQEELYTK